MDPLKDLPYLLPEEFRANAVETICGVYHVNRARHDPAAGDDSFTFGSHSYRNIHNALEAHFEGNPQVVASREHGAVVLEVATDAGPVWVRSYKAGTTRHDDPRAWRCDDREAGRRHAARNGAGRQLSLFAEGETSERDLPRALVLLHVGNEIDGALGVYLGAPEVRDGQHVGWHFLTCLWRADTTTTDLAADSDAVGFRHQPKPDVRVGLRTEALPQPGAAGEHGDH